MAYDGTIMQRALACFDQAKQRRADELEQRRRLAFARQPRLAEIAREQGVDKSAVRHSVKSGKAAMRKYLKKFL